MLTAQSLFELNKFSHQDLFEKNDHAWIALNRLKEYLMDFSHTPLRSTYLQENTPLQETVVYWEGNIISGHDLVISFGDTTKGELIVSRKGVILKGASVIMAGSVLMGEKITIGQGVLIESGAMIKSPAIIGDMTEIRHGAYMRGNTLIGNSCVIGHTTELKHAIFFNRAKAGHFAYLGDSILGDNANLGAGTKFANLKFLPGNVKITTANGLIDTGRRKLGAILGDGSQTGCNSVTNPGTIMGKGCMLLPNTTAKSGYHKPSTVLR